MSNLARQTAELLARCDEQLQAMNPVHDTHMFNEGLLNWEKANDYLRHALRLMEESEA